MPAGRVAIDSGVCHLPDRIALVEPEALENPFAQDCLHE